ncbi:hypothetical protein G4B88_028718 [Cannabis sativa]|uniref:4-coumarate--CoA ligase n=1 Tax=Cannabis sativa TaxID=3483 RepID=A0A7J6EWD8_CANSA|nr:hypothetical protein G4B88_028718 [Cannabis sativa]
MWGCSGAIDILSKEGSKPPLLVLILECDDQLSIDVNSSNSSSNTISAPVNLEYERLLSTGNHNFEVIIPKDEWDPISLNYTSGTTSSPKGVIYTQRGAYLNSLAGVLLNEIHSMAVYLWCVPMFHCNSWCLPWGIAAQGGTNVYLRNVTAKGIFDSIAQHKVTHMGGAPTILNMIINASATERKPLPSKVSIMTGAAPSILSLLFKMEEMGFNVTHSYGLTVTYGLGTVCTWKPEWDSLPRDAQAKLKSRQGVQHLGIEELDVKDPVTLKSVPADAKIIGEVMFRRNTVMNGYLKNVKATQEAFDGGWFRIGDLGVKHPDAVLEAAVVARPDDHWGETPCAFVNVKSDANVSGDEIISFCRSRLPHYMAPRTVIFQDLPKTSTGKVQKFVLREKAKSMESLTKKNISKL